MRDEVKADVAAQVARGHRVPCLAVVAVGHAESVKAYVRGKAKACEAVGMTAHDAILGDDATQAHVVEQIRALNEDSSVDGIMVQLPLPPGMQRAAVLQEVSFKKDVDGMHPVNVGLLTLNYREPLYRPCTPFAVMELLRQYGVETAGKSAAVVGSSNTVGVPMATMLMQSGATVTSMHRLTPPEVMRAACRAADIVVVAVGQAGFLRADHVKQGAVVIDVGINAVPDAAVKGGFRLTGDCDFEGICEVPGVSITPVPRGVGPVTVATLLSNTARAARYWTDGIGGQHGQDPGMPLFLRSEI